MDSASSLQRIAVVGTSCSGKSTLAALLSARLEIEHIELDSLYWGPNWTPVESEVFRQRVHEATSPDSWICDGNYSSVRDIVWSRATCVVWLNYPLGMVLGRALRRTVSRCLFRTPLFAGNRETFRLSFFSRDSVLLWAIRTHGRHRKGYRKHLEDPVYNHLKVIELRSSADADRLLEFVSGCGKLP